MVLFTLKVTGPQNIESAFSDFSTNMSKYAIQEPLYFAFKNGERIARTEVPVRTGFLRSSIRSETVATGARLVAAAPYALYVDQGTRYMPARPFFTHAVDEIQRMLPQLVQGAISEQAARLNRKWFGG